MGAIKVSRKEVPLTALPLTLRDVGKDTCQDVDDTDRTERRWGSIVPSIGQDLLHFSSKYSDPGDLKVSKQ